MPSLFDELKQSSIEWRGNGYACDDYPLIGAIVATEFAMSLRYPEGGFMKNALVLAPGTTAAVAGKPDRRRIMADLNKGAVQTTMKRLQDIIRVKSQPVTAFENPQPCEKCKLK